MSEPSSVRRTRGVQPLLLLAVLSALPAIAQNEAGGHEAGGHEATGHEAVRYEAILFADLFPGVSDPDSLTLGFGAGPTPHSAHPSDFALYDGRLFFAATDSTRKRGLWVYDGTTGEPARVTHPLPGLGRDANPREPTVVAGRLYLVVNGSYPHPAWDLWVYDAATDAPPTSIGVVTRDGQAEDGLVYPSDLVAYDGRLFFNAIGGGLGHELWTYDAATGEATLAADVYPGGGDSHAGPTEFAVYDGRLFFAADDGEHGHELWAYDARTGEATLVADLAPTPTPTPDGRVPLRHGSSPGDLVVYDGRLFFAADDGKHGRELWVYDARTAEATMAANINPDHAVPYVASSEPSGLTVYEGRLFFAASDGRRGWELWAYDAATSEASLVANINAGDIPASEGSPFPVSVGSSSPKGFALYDDRLFFAADDGECGSELWSYDATTGEVSLVADVRPGPFSSAPGELQAYGGRLYFVADDGEHGRELWVLSRLNPVGTPD